MAPPAKNVKEISSMLDSERPRQSSIISFFHKTPKSKPESTSMTPITAIAGRMQLKDEEDEEQDIVRPSKVLQFGFLKSIHL